MTIQPGPHTGRQLSGEDQGAGREPPTGVGGHSLGVGYLAWRWRRWRRGRGLLGAAVSAGTAALVLACGACSGTTGAPGASITPPGVPVTTAAPVPLTVVSDRAALEQFAPRSATAWWALVQAVPRAYVVRTVDGGRHWQDASPTVAAFASAFILDTEAAWVEVGAAAGPEPVFRTADGGRHWTQVGAVPETCSLDFVDQVHGWCTFLGAAAGSERVDLYRTVDGGSSWAFVSRTGLYDEGSSSGALPSSCSKQLTFTSATTGWATAACPGGKWSLFVSRDAGAHWQAGVASASTGGRRGTWAASDCRR